MYAWEPDESDELQEAALLTEEISENVASLRRLIREIRHAQRIKGAQEQQEEEE